MNTYATEFSKNTKEFNSALAELTDFFQLLVFRAFFSLFPLPWEESTWYNFEYQVVPIVAKNNRY